MAAKDLWYLSNRVPALWQFAILLTVFNIAGHTLLGFEPSWAQAIVGVLAACTMQFVLEWVDARASRRPARFSGRFPTWTQFLLPAYIPGLNCSMLLYANDRLWPIAFATGVAIASKSLFRVRVGERHRHFFNPANFGISLTLLLFPWVGIAPPYQYTENLRGGEDWILLGVLVVFGGYMNARLTRRLPLIAAWLGGFILQAILRSQIFDTPLEAALMPMTGVAFLLYTFYMIMDPPTTPAAPRAQVAFGLAVAAVYGILISMVHVVFGLFFALAIVGALRGLGLWVHTRYKEHFLNRAPVPGPAVAGRTDR